VRVARTARRDEVPAPPAAVPARKAESIDGAEDAGDERARMKRELLRALAALR
jgi:hypothetical protein